MWNCTGVWQCALYKCTLLGTLTDRKIDFYLHQSCLSVRKKTLGYHCKVFRDILYWGLLAKYIEKLKFGCNRKKNHAILTKTKTIPIIYYRIFPEIIRNALDTAVKWVIIHIPWKTSYITPTSKLQFARKLRKYLYNQTGHWHWRKEYSTCMTGK